MRRLLPTFLLLTGWIGAAAAEAPAPLDVLHATEPAKSVPAFSISTGAGGTTMLSDYRGKILVVNVWATWCLPCRKEMPALSRFAERVGASGVEVLPIAVDREGIAAVEKFYQRFELKNLPALAAPAADVVAAFERETLPYTVFIGADGKEFARINGPADWDDPEFPVFLRVIAKRAAE